MSEIVYFPLPHPENPRWVLGWNRGTGHRVGGTLEWFAARDGYTTIASLGCDHIPGMPAGVCPACAEELIHGPCQCRDCTAVYID